MMLRFLRFTPGIAALLTLAVGCGPRPPEVVLEKPADYPAAVGERRMFNTPGAYIYARTENDAGEADRWLRDLTSYIRKEHRSELEKGIIIVMAPEDAPLATTLEAQMQMERDPALMPTQPSHPKTVEEIRQRMEKEGIPENEMVRATPLPLGKSRLQSMGIHADATWAVAAPSHELAKTCGMEVGVAAIRKQRPDVSEEQARSLVNRMSSSFAKPFEMVRPIPVFILWAQRQKDWTDDQRREAIRKQIKQLYRSNWMPVPSDEELQW